MDLTEMGRAAVAAKYEVQKMTAEDKNVSLKAVAEGLLRDKAVSYTHLGCRRQMRRL